MTQRQMLASLWVYGQDAAIFLDGQLSVSVTALDHQWTIGAYCSAQGKVIAVIWVIDWIIDGKNGYLLLMPKDLVLSVQQRLQKFVLRSKVAIEILPIGISFVNEPVERGCNEEEFAHSSLFNTISDDGDWKSIRLAGIGANQLRISLYGSTENTVWLAINKYLIMKGIPFIYSATTEQFLPQMLGLLTIGGIDFQKGCYVGQEVIARMHYKSQVRKHLTWSDAPMRLGNIIKPGIELFNDKRKAATILSYVENNEGAVIQTVIQEQFIGQSLHLLDDDYNQFTFLSNRTSLQGI